jgi:hypothetical protein
LLIFNVVSSSLVVTVICHCLFMVSFHHFLLSLFFAILCYCYFCLLWWNLHVWLKAHYTINVTLYYFLKYPCLNFNHVIINMDFHNVCAYYDKEKHKEIKWQHNYFKKLHMMWC